MTGPFREPLSPYTEDNGSQKEAEFDVAVVGGGPAGSACALDLARAGRSVVLIDKARSPRDKCCGDGLTTDALRRLRDMGLRPSSVPSWTDVEACWVRSPAGHTVEFPMRAGVGFAAVARREELDAALLALAADEGVKVHEGHAVTAVETSADGVAVTAGDLGSITARYLVGADGMWSTVRKLTGAQDEDGYLGEWHAFRQYFTGVSEKAAKQLWVWFEADLLPGYAWSFPLGDGRANLGFGIRRQPGAPTKTMKDQWQDILSRRHINDVLGPDAQPESPHKAWPIPARIGSTALSAGGGRVLFVGDAARATDPLTGEGIGQALQTGQLAAAAIVATGPFDPESAARRYARSTQAELARDHALAGRLSDWLANRAVTEATLRLAGSTDWTRRNFARWLFEDYPRAVLATPSRWALLRAR